MLAPTNRHYQHPFNGKNISWHQNSVDTYLLAHPYQIDITQFGQNVSLNHTCCWVGKASLHLASEHVFTIKHLRRIE